MLSESCFCSRPSKTAGPLPRKGHDGLARGGIPARPDATHVWHGERSPLATPKPALHFVAPSQARVHACSCAPVAGAQGAVAQPPHLLSSVCRLHWAPALVTILGDIFQLPAGAQGVAAQPAHPRVLCPAGHPARVCACWQQVCACLCGRHSFRWVAVPGAVVCELGWCDQLFGSRWPPDGH